MQPDKNIELKGNRKKREMKNADKYPRTVPLELLEAWQKLRRHGESSVMAEKLGYSRPTIDKALNYGYCPSVELPDKINKYFADRMNSERESAAELDAMREGSNKGGQ